MSHMPEKLTEQVQETSPQEMGLNPHEVAFAQQFHEFDKCIT